MEKKQQFLPALLDRLLDEEPKKQKEDYDAFYYDSRAMRNIVQGDIAALLNNTNIEDQLDEDKHKHVAESVVNYGIAALAVVHATHHNWSIIERNLRNAILRFEPRIVPETLIVRPLIDKDQPCKNGMVLFEIRGMIHWYPHPIDLCINGAYDVETAKVDLKTS